MKRPDRRGLGGLGSALTLGMGVGLGLGANDTAQAQARVRVQGAGQDGFQFVPIETLAVEQLGGGAIRVSTPTASRSSRLAVALRQRPDGAAVHYPKRAGVAEAWAMQAPAIAASTAPVLVQLPMAPAAARRQHHQPPPQRPLSRQPPRRARRRSAWLPVGRLSPALRFTPDTACSAR